MKEDSVQPRSVFTCCQGKVNSRVRDKIGLKLCQIDIQGAVEPQGGSDRTDHLSKKSVEIGVRRSFDVEISSTDII